MTSIGERLRKFPGRGADQKATDSDTSHEKRSKKKIELLKRLAAIGIISSGIVGAFLGIGGSLEGRASDASDPEDGGGDGKPGESLGGADINPLDQDLVAVPSSTPPRRPTQAPTISRPTQTPTENPVRITPTAELMTERELLAQWRESSYANFLELSSDEINRQLQIIQENLPDEYRAWLIGVDLREVADELKNLGYSIDGFDFSKYQLIITDKEGNTTGWWSGMAGDPVNYTPSTNRENGVVRHEDVLETTIEVQNGEEIEEVEIRITIYVEEGSTYKLSDGIKPIALRFSDFDKENPGWFFESFQKAFEEFYPEHFKNGNGPNIFDILKNNEIMFVLMNEDLTSEKEWPNGLQVFFRDRGFVVKEIPAFSEEAKNVIICYISVPNELGFNGRPGDESAAFEIMFLHALEGIMLEDPNHPMIDNQQEFARYWGTQVYPTGPVGETYNWEEDGSLIKVVPIPN